MQKKTTAKKIARKLANVVHALSGKQKPTSMAALSLDNAKAIYGSRPDVHIHHFVRESDFVFEPPKHLPEDSVFEGYPSTFSNAPGKYDAVLLDIRNPQFSFQHNHLIDDLNRPIYEACVPFKRLPIQHEYLIMPPRLNGTVAYFSNTRPNHYGHWIQAQLPLLLSYWETFGKDNIDYYYVGDGPVADFAEESMAKMGIKRSQLVNYPCRADRSLISVACRDLDEGSLRTGFGLDKSSHRFMQENLFKPRPGQYAKKIYVMRGNVTVRRELNLAETKAALEPHGFVFMDMEGKTMQQEADIFGNADVIIAVHGSALHNTLFCRPHTKIVEIFPYGYYDDSNHNLCSYSECEYHYLIGEKLSQGIVGTSHAVRNNVDIKIDTEKLLRLCRETDIIPAHQSVFARA